MYTSHIIVKKKKRDKRYTVLLYTVKEHGKVQVSLKNYVGNYVGNYYSGAKG